MVDDMNTTVVRHEQRISTLERDMETLKTIQAEIRTMSETLVNLANEIKHTNEHLARHERKIDVIESQPKLRMQQITTAIIAALAGGIISTFIGLIIK